MGTVDFRPPLQDFEDDGSAAQGQEKADEHAFSEGFAGLQRERKSGQAGQGHLNRAGYQDRSSDLQEIGKGKLHTDSEK
jgi:hypothetical protein